MAEACGRETAQHAYGDAIHTGGCVLDLSERSNEIALREIRGDPSGVL
jgi:hypothetical protein